MQQHPVPQNVTSYQFRLIGDMTLTQFLELLAGGVIAYIFYSTNLIGIIKYALMFISVIMGVAFAFLPLEGRPLSQWTMAFIRAIYMPTQFYWEKKPKLPDYLSNTPLLKSPPITTPTPNNPAPSPMKEEPLVKEFEEQHSKRIEELMSLYKEVPTTTPSLQTTTVQSPKSKIQNPTSINSAPVSRIETTIIEPVSIRVSPTPDSKPQAPNPTPIVSTSDSELPSPTMTTQQPTINTAYSPPTNTNPTGSLAIFNEKLPFPSVPETPNTLVGMVFDKTGNIIENAVVEIKNNGGTVRATKTNRLGQFFLATPLNTDSYTIYIEKEKFIFTPISLKLEGKIYPPLEIRSNN